MVYIMCHSIINTTSKPFKSTVVLRGGVSHRGGAMRRYDCAANSRGLSCDCFCPILAIQTKRDISLSLERYRCCCCCCDGVRDTSTMAHKRERGHQEAPQEEEGGGPDTTSSSSSSRSSRSSSSSRGAKRAQRGSQASERARVSMLRCCSFRCPTTTTTTAPSTSQPPLNNNNNNNNISPSCRSWPQARTTTPSTSPRLRRSQSTDTPRDISSERELGERAVLLLPAILLLFCCSPSAARTSPSPSQTPTTP